MARSELQFNYNREDFGAFADFNLRDFGAGMKTSCIAQLLLCPLIVLIFNTSDVFSDIVVTLSPSGSDTLVQAVGSLDVTGAGVSSVGFGNVVTLSNVTTQITGGASTSPSGSLYDINAFGTFGTAPNVTQIVTANPDGFFIAVRDRTLGVGPPVGNFDSVSVPSQFVSGSSASLSHTIFNETFSTLGLASGDLWGYTIPILDPAGNDTGLTQTVTFRAVPEPSFLCLAPCLAAMMLKRRRR